jgi:hypothetical protein
MRTYEPQYQGCQIFEIFEDRYKDDLGSYLRLVNNGLF